jgi:hypothetical protein
MSREGFANPPLLRLLANAYSAGTLGGATRKLKNSPAAPASTGVPSHM